MIFQCFMKSDIHPRLAKNNEYIDKVFYVKAKDDEDCYSILCRMLCEEEVPSSYLPLTVSYERYYKSPML